MDALKFTCGADALVQIFHHAGRRHTHSPRIHAVALGDARAGAYIAARIQSRAQRRAGDVRSLGLRSTIAAQSGWVVKVWFSRQTPPGTVQWK